MTEYQVVASFRVTPHPGVGREEVRGGVLDVLIHDLADTEGHVSNLSIAIREIGAQGESSEMEGEWPPGATRKGAEGHSRAGKGPETPCTV